MNILLSLSHLIIFKSAHWTFVSMIKVKGIVHSLLLTLMYTFFLVWNTQEDIFVHTMNVLKNN